MHSVIGMLAIVGFAYAISSSRQSVAWKTIVIAFAIQFTVGGLALFTTWGNRALNAAADATGALLSYSRAGIDFMFGQLAAYDGPIGFVFAVNVLPVVVFFSAFIAVLYHLGIMMWIVRILGGGLRRCLGTSHAESMSAAANIFVGQAEAPLVVKPFIPRMTQSELFAIMVGGLSTIAGSVMAGYVALGIPLEYLVTASFMAAPGGLMMAKLIEPEQAVPVVPNQDDQATIPRYVNIIDAAASGALDGLRMAAAIAAMLIAFVALIALVNGILQYFGAFVGFESITLEMILGVLLSPAAWLLGVPWAEASTVGSLIGQKLILNEFVAYVAFSEVSDTLSPISQAIVIFALCGFANLSSIAILLGGLGAIAPTRRDDISRLGVRALIAATLANLMSASLAGFFLSLPGAAG
ncbi:NupC/NupG family nucleoside CNT transporter [Luminiphilus sp.]|jgi:CNT family concentrative nucleoside transporter|nr:NupC/NupG family nucleoside CNT transporter [Luminiphilus sp.]MDA9877854.1 NupC/NupG family nucleoside CNT transporter [Luminiphilus sp.]MDB2585460.1 NupC/NupG family nucleoside CNT transporter [Luminiphilus sp.]MDC0507711.1 NupC/NupG family nucleoside CNT transporter [Luminiphilus sp.]MDC3197473.1 NupC/NupG family nucleoside CNT transporter [Luminiphilus sp.]